MRAKVSKKTEPKAEPEVQKPTDAKAGATAAPAAAVEPSKEQLEKARVESEKALKEFERQGAGDSTLTRYFREMIGHRVLTPQGPLYTIPCEGPINTHPQVRRTALVGIGPTGSQEAALVVEPLNSEVDGEKLLKEVAQLAKVQELTAGIKHFLIHPHFPVDIRHNAKIFREKLSIWAEKELKGR